LCQAFCIKMQALREKYAAPATTTEGTAAAKAEAANATEGEGED
jgi:hypothetical protein